MSSAAIDRFVEAAVSSYLRRQTTTELHAATAHIPGEDLADWTQESIELARWTAIAVLDTDVLLIASRGYPWIVYRASLDGAFELATTEEQITQLRKRQQEAQAHSDPPPGPHRPRDQPHAAVDDALKYSPAPHRRPTPQTPISSTSLSSQRLIISLRATRNPVCYN